eukprot:747788-Hanusia_phi.AAC.7
MARTGREERGKEKGSKNGCEERKELEEVATEEAERTGKWQWEGRGGARKHRKSAGRMIWSGIKSGIKGGVKTVRKASSLSMQLYEGKPKGSVE